MREEKKGEWGLIKLTPSQPGFCALRDGVTPGHSEAWPAGGGEGLSGPLATGQQTPCSAAISPRPASGFPGARRHPCLSGASISL